jgi:hypothetical protein
VVLFFLSVRFSVGLFARFITYFAALFYYHFSLLRFDLQLAELGGALASGNHERIAIVHAFGALRPRAESRRDVLRRRPRTVIGVGHRAAIRRRVDGFTANTHKHIKIRTIVEKC